MTQEQTLSQQLESLLKLNQGKGEQEPQDDSRFPIDRLTGPDTTQSQAQTILGGNRDFYFHLVRILSDYNRLDMPTYDIAMQQPDRIPYEVARLVVELDTYCRDLSVLSPNELEAIAIAFSQALADWRQGVNIREPNRAYWRGDFLVSPNTDSAKRIQDDVKFIELLGKAGDMRSRLFDMVFMALVASQDYYQALQLASWAEDKYNYTTLLSKLEPTLIALVQKQAGAFNERMLVALSLVNNPNEPGNAVYIADPTQIAAEAREMLIRLYERSILGWKEQQKVISLSGLGQELYQTSLQNRILTSLSSEDGQPPEDYQALDEFGDKLARKIASALQVNQLLSSLVSAIHPEVTAQLVLQIAQSEATGHTAKFITAFPDDELAASYGPSIQGTGPDLKNQIMRQTVEQDQLAVLLRDPDLNFHLRDLINYLKKPQYFLLSLDNVIKKIQKPEEKRQAQAARQAVLLHLAAGLNWLQTLYGQVSTNNNPILNNLLANLGTVGITPVKVEEAYQYLLKETNGQLPNQLDQTRSFQAELTELLPQLAQYTDESGLLALIRQLVFSNIDRAASALLEKLKEELEEETQTKRETQGENRQKVGSLNQQISDLEKSLTELQQLIDGQNSVNQQQMQKKQQDIEELEKQKAEILAMIQESANQSSPLAVQIQKLEEWLAKRSSQNS